MKFITTILMVASVFAHADESISMSKFKQMSSNISAKDVPAKFGFPSKMHTVTSPNGEQVGITWTYDKNVKEGSHAYSSKFTFVEGNLALVNIE